MLFLLFSKLIGSINLLQKQKKNDNVQTQVEGENGGSNEGGNMQLQEYNAITSFTQFLTAPLRVDDDFLDQNLF